MPTIIRCGGGIPSSDYDALNTKYNTLNTNYNNLNTEYSSYKSSHSHTDTEYTNYGTSQYNAGVTAAKNAISSKSIKESSTMINYSNSYKYGTVIDTGTTTKKAVTVHGCHSGSASDGGAQGSNNNSSWTNISTGYYTYRYYRPYAKGNDESSSCSFGYVGVIDLG